MTRRFLLFGPGLLLVFGLLFLRASAGPPRALAAPPDAGALPGDPASPDLLRSPPRARVAEVRPDSVRLRVRDAESGHPVPRATVVWYARAGVAVVERREAPCDAEGRWSGTPFPDRPFFVRAPGYVDQDARAALDAGSCEHEVGLRAIGLRTVALDVVDAAGRPVPGATVRFARPVGVTATADGAGRVTLRLAGDTPSLRIQGEVEAQGFVLRPFDALDDGHGRVRVWNAGLLAEAGSVVLDRSASVHGRVVDAEGTLRAGVRVCASLRPPRGDGCGEGGATPGAWSATSDATGAYELAGLPAGRPLFWHVAEEPAAGEPTGLGAGATRIDWRLDGATGGAR